MNRIATRMWLLSALMTVITMVVALATFYGAIYLQLYEVMAEMPAHARAETERLIASGEKGSERYFELYDRYGGDTVRTDDLQFIGAIVLISSAIGGVVAFVFARRIARPITAVARAASQVAAGDRSARVGLDGASGETGELFASFNRMAADIEIYERERTVLTAGIAHELRTPLTILQGRLHGIIDGVIQPDEDEPRRLLRQVKQLSRQVEDLRTLAHADAGELDLDLRRVNAGHVLQAATADLATEAAKASVKFESRCVDTPIRVDPVRLTQVLTIC